MPAGIDNPTIGYIAFCGVKLVGYTMAAHWLSSLHRREEHSAWVIGGVRTAIGIVVGAIYYLLCPLPGVAYLAGLFPIRLAEWWFLLWLFYRPRDEKESFDSPAIIVGTVWSYLLDLPATLGLLVTGGFSVC